MNQVFSEFKNEKQKKWKNWKFQLENTNIPKQLFFSIFSPINHQTTEPIFSNFSKKFKVLNQIKSILKYKVLKWTTECFDFPHIQFQISSKSQPFSPLFDRTYLVSAGSIFSANKISNFGGGYLLEATHRRSAGLLKSKRRKLSCMLFPSLNVTLGWKKLSAMKKSFWDDFSQIIKLQKLNFFYANSSLWLNLAHFFYLVTGVIRWFHRNIFDLRL